MNETWYKAYFAALAAGYANPSLVPEKFNADEWAGVCADSSEEFLASESKRKQEQFDADIRAKRKDALAFTALEKQKEEILKIGRYNVFVKGQHHLLEVAGINESNEVYFWSTKTCNNGKVVYVQLCEFAGENPRAVPAPPSDEEEKAERGAQLKADVETDKSYAERATKIRRFTGRFRDRDAHFIVRSISPRGGCAVCDVLLLHTNGAVDHSKTAIANAESVIDLDLLLDPKHYTPFPIDDD